MNINEKLYEIGSIPVIKIDDPEKAVPLARALLRRQAAEQVPD